MGSVSIARRTNNEQTPGCHVYSLSPPTTCNSHGRKIHILVTSTTHLGGKNSILRLIIIIKEGVCYRTRKKESTKVHISGLSSHATLNFGLNIKMPIKEHKIEVRPRRDTCIHTYPGFENWLPCNHYSLSIQLTRDQQPKYT